MSIFDTLFGVSDANVQAAKMDTTAGTRALRQQSKNLSGQLGAQQYGLAASARGSNSPLALREAQRRSQMGQQAIGAQALTAQGQLEQQAAQANQQAQMQANMQNAQIEMANDQAFSKILAAGIGGAATGLTMGAAPAGAAAMSDVRAKENVRPMYSDFVMKEPTIRPAPAGGATMTSFPIMPRDPNAESRAAFGLNIDRRPTTTLEQGAIERNTIDDIQGRSSRPAQYIPQMMRPGVQPEQLTNRAIATHLRDRREKEELEAQIAAEQADRRFNPLALSLRAYADGMQSDFTSKELRKARPASGAVFNLSPERIDRMGRFEVEQAQRNYEAAQQRAAAEALWKYRRGSAQAINDQAARNYGSSEPRRGPPVPLAFSSDFRAKEMTADESRAALAPIDPVNYRYKPEAAARMAVEQGATPAERSMVFRDKRAPRDGIIAQQLQQSPAFAPSVMNTPAGLAVERDRALSTNLAATAGQAKVNDEQDEEIRALKRIVVRALGREVAG